MGGQPIIALRFTTIATPRRSAPCPVETLGPGRRGLRCSSITIEQRGSPSTIAKVPQCLGSAQPHQRSVIIPQAVTLAGQVRLAGEQVINRCSYACCRVSPRASRNSQHLANHSLLIEGKGTRLWTVCQQGNRAGQIAIAALESSEIIHVTRIAQGIGGDRQPSILGGLALQQRQPRHGQVARGLHRQLKDLAGGPFGIALPQQRVHALRLVISVELRAIQPGKVGLGRATHRAPTPRGARSCQRLWPI